VLQPFDPAKFNFSKAAAPEALFHFLAAPASARRLGGSADAGGVGYSARAPLPNSPNLVLINVSPIEYGHVLLVPRALSRLPQRLDCESLLLALQFASAAANPYFRVGYNSLGAFATINHLHFQAYYLAAPFPVERAPTTALQGAGGRERWGSVRCHQLTSYPVRALCLEAGESLVQLSRVLFAACEALQAANLPFNLLICDKGGRVFLMPQAFAQRCREGEVAEEALASGINPAAFELAGHLLYKRQEDYEAASQESAWRLLAAASLTQREFDDVLRLVLPRMSAAA
jgi:GDP-L-galactose phosphorylase